jgi:V-type H+-transporting ATPase subunit C
LTDVVKAEDLVLGSEYMESLLFVLHQDAQEDWHNSYEQLVPMAAVPRSARLIVQEGDYCLYAVVVLKKYKEPFIQAAQNKKFIPRLDFQFIAEAASDKNDESAKLESEVKSLWVLREQEGLRVDLIVHCRRRLFGCSKQTLEKFLPVGFI